MDSTIDKTAEDGLREHLGRSIAGLAAGLGQLIFSGVCVARGDRRFLATARHCIEGLDVKDLHVFTMGRPNTFEPAPVVRVASHPRLDIAVIEVPSDYAGALKAEWLPPSRMTSKDLSPGRGVWLIGFPSELAKATGTAFVACRPLIIQTSITKRDPGDDIRALLEPNVDVLCEYTNLPNLKGEHTPPPTSLRGMSGCGAFAVPLVREGDLWLPTTSTLAGLQVSEFRDSGFIKTLRVEPLLELLDRV